MRMVNTPAPGCGFLHRRGGKSSSTLRGPQLQRFVLLVAFFVAISGCSHGDSPLAVVVSAWAPLPTVTLTSVRRGCTARNAGGPLFGKRKQPKRQKQQQPVPTNDAGEAAASTTATKPILSKEEEELVKRKVDEKPLQELLSENFSFNSYDPSNVDMEQLPVPFFTTAVITVASLAVWGYIFYIALVGLPDTNTALTLPGLANPPSL